jgi:hypothetical protein
MHNQRLSESIFPSGLRFEAPASPAILASTDRLRLAFRTLFGAIGRFKRWVF